MNAVNKQQLMDRVIRAIERDSRSSSTASSDQLRRTSEQLADQVRKVESTFQRAAQLEKLPR